MKINAEIIDTLKTIKLSRQGLVYTDYILYRKVSASSSQKKRALGMTLNCIW